jgi:D-lactate dehydrogenase (cytochrome)
VPLSRLPDLVAAAEARAAGARIKTFMVAHAGDGNVHHFIAFDKDDAEEVAEAHAFNAFLVKTAQDMDGTCTGEHGVGFGKLGFVERELGAPACEVMRKIKVCLQRRAPRRLRRVAGARRHPPPPLPPLAPSSRSARWIP